MEPAKIVAEIGCNHMGDFALAKKMIESAALCGADYVKFQKRCPRELLTSEEYDAPHPTPWHSYGSTYGAHREALELSIDAHRELKQHCDAIGIGYACSVWDITSAHEIISLHPDYIKIPSAMNICRPLLEYICANFPSALHVSLGMTTRDEEFSLFDWFVESGVKNDIVAYHCTSAYPAAFESLCLLNIARLAKQYPGLEIGYSGHNYGIAVDVAAFAIGATWIERHFTLDRTWKGTDHAASLEPTGLNKLCRDIKATAKALTERPPGLLDIEIEQRRKLKKTALNAVEVI